MSENDPMNSIRKHNPNQNNIVQLALKDYREKREKQKNQKNQRRRFPENRFRA
jgi:hypothetical protein